jgi:hypothetical protein
MALRIKAALISVICHSSESLSSSALIGDWNPGYKRTYNILGYRLGENDGFT